MSFLKWPNKLFRAKSEQSSQHFLSKKPITITAGALAVILLAGCAIWVCLLQNSNIAVSAEAGTSSTNGSISSENVSNSAKQSAEESSSSESEAESSLAETELESSSSLPEQTIPATASVNESSFSVPAGCSHTYVSETILPTCLSEGYTTHTCTKCGESFTDSYTPPQHDYEKYVCGVCGAPDPEIPYDSLYAWIILNMPFDDAGRYREWRYTEGDWSYSIYCDEYYSGPICFEGYNSSTDEYISLSFTQDGPASLYYSIPSAYGQLVTKKSSVTPSMDFPLDYFYTQEGWENTGLTEADFTRMFYEKANHLMTVVETKMLSPRLGFHVSMLGFNSY